MRKISVAFLLFNFLFLNHVHANCFDLVKKFFKKANYTTGQLPSNIEIVPLKISQREIDLWENTKQSRYEYGGIQFLNASGEELEYISFTSMSAYSLDGKDMILNYNHLVSRLENKKELNKYVKEPEIRERLKLYDDMKLARVRIIHSHPTDKIAPSLHNVGMPDAVTRLFSVQDKKLSLQLKAAFDTYNLEIDFDFGIIFQGKNEDDIEGKVYTLPKELNWKNRDFEIDRDMEKELNKILAEFDKKE